jgi:hypothetical protein
MSSSTRSSANRTVHMERYYAWDWGDVHFVAIDTTQRDAQQLAWLDADLRASKQPWKIVFGHHPMYTSSVRTAGPEKQIVPDEKIHDKPDDPPHDSPPIPLTFLR